MVEQHHVVKYVGTENHDPPTVPGWYHSACCPCWGETEEEWSCESPDEFNHQIMDTTDLLMFQLIDLYHDLWIEQGNLP